MADHHGQLDTNELRATWLIERESGEHTGRNAHDDLCDVLLSWRTTWEIWRLKNQGGCPVLETACHEPVAKRQTRNSQEPKPALVLSQVHEVVGAIYCALLRNQKTGLVHIPQGVQQLLGPKERCKIRVLSERVPLSGEPEQRPNGSGYDRSSAEFVAALCSACLQDGASCAGAHTCTKAVLLGSTTTIWLKGALHGAS